MPLAKGARLGSYEIVAALGAGGMGEVYRARDTRLDRQVAVKVLGDKVVGQLEWQQRFEREARIASAPTSRYRAKAPAGPAAVFRRPDGQRIQAKAFLAVEIFLSPG
jgi:hypothetical protein